MPYNPTRALQLLRLGTQNPAATFRDGQEEAIQHVVNGRGRLLVVQKTGWGKSSVYFIATKLLREQGLGPAILISPLLALMRNQIAAAERMGIRAARFSHDNKEYWEAEGSKARNGQIDILLSTPEQLSNPAFVDGILGPVAGNVSLLVIDEAHCISDWGHDFRPHYRQIQKRIASLPRNLRVLATTATANERVIADLVSVLGPDFKVVRGKLYRESLFLQTIRLPDPAERMAWLTEQLSALEGHGIIYALTVRDTKRLAEWLQHHGHNVQAYHSELLPERAHELEDALQGNRIKALVATTKLGMGYDKPDLSFVIHYQTPGSVVAYYQQVGRAGRAVPHAYGVLLSGKEDTEITDSFRNGAFPTRDEVKQVLAALETAPYSLSKRELTAHVNMSEGRIEKALLLMSLESPAPVVRQERKWMLAAAELSEAFWQRADNIISLRKAEQDQMQEYVGLKQGHMEFLIDALDGEIVAFQPPNLPPLPTTADAGLVQEAIAFLRRSNLPLEPRKNWPPGGLANLGVRGNTNIAPERNLRPGRILCMWGDAGWGESVRLGKYRDGHYSDDLVTACASMVREWAPNPAPQWVTSIPSLRHPDLVPDFARRLAAALNLPFHVLLEKTDPRRPQKEMANSAQQARNVDGSLRIHGSVPTGPVLLVDDMVDSKWTLTVAAYLLTSNGSGPVHPLALASTAHSDE
jgi:ATP-dependent DNA helicase RecQ